MLESAFYEFWLLWVLLLIVYKIYTLFDNLFGGRGGGVLNIVL